MFARLPMMSQSAPSIPDSALFERHAAAEIGGHIGGLPDVLDVFRILADHERLQVLIDRCRDGQRSFAVRGATDAVKARFAGQHLDDDQVIRAGLCQDCFDVGNFERRQTAGGRLRGGAYGQGSAGCEAASGCQEAKCVASIHRSRIYP